MQISQSVENRKVFNDFLTVNGGPKIKIQVINKHSVRKVVLISNKDCWNNTYK